MSLDLDKRQRAMLSEMGIKLWQAPNAQNAAPNDAATEVGPAAVPSLPLAQPGAEGPVAPKARPVAPPTAAETSKPTRTTAQDEESDANTGPSWQLGNPQPMYSTLASEQNGPTAAIRWLVLAELPTGATQALNGEAGQLLDNMLRAAAMHRDAGLQFVQVQRGRGTEPANENQSLQDQLAALIRSHRPSAVLVMGRLAAQALLPSAEPFAKRRGQVLSLAGCPVLLTYDTTYLLRNLTEKARAWEDLCMARAMATRGSVT